MYLKKKTQHKNILFVRLLFVGHRKKKFKLQCISPLFTHRKTGIIIWWNNVKKLWKIFWWCFKDDHPGIINIFFKYNIYGRMEKLFTLLHIIISFVFCFLFLVLFSWKTEIFLLAWEYRFFLFMLSVQYIVIHTLMLYYKFMQQCWKICKKRKIVFAFI